MIVSNSRGVHYSNLYGTNSALGSKRGGTVFRLGQNGKFVVLHAFGDNGGTDGWLPYASLVVDNGGNLYGTTAAGGTNDQGTVYKLDHRTGAETILSSFGNPPNGAYPTGSLLLDGQGNLYGTTAGNNNGGASTVFKLDPQGVETPLFTFNGGDGQGPAAGLIRDGEGNFYSTTSAGGTFGIGTVFELDPSGNETVLHDFDGDGSTPYSALVRDSAGNMYGTTYMGGLGVGIIYEIDASGKFSVLHQFNTTDGALPWAGLTLDQAGNLYGTTTAGGDPVCNCGVVFRITP
jgi:uncharacterized repeat protein (TIGR03803 family)